MNKEQNKIVVFQEKQIRRVWYKKEWWFVIEDVVGALSESANPKNYVRDMRRRDPELSKGWGQIAHTLVVETEGGRQKMNCANTEGIFRIIQSIPSPKAEPFKLWLAKVGYERVQEIENPELAAERARQYYRDLGYDEKWIETRLQTIAIRGQLTDEWKNRGVKSMLGIFRWSQKQGVFSSVLTFLREHSGDYVTEKRLKQAEKDLFWAQRENPQHALKKG